MKFAGKNQILRFIYQKLDMQSSVAQTIEQAFQQQTKLNEKAFKKNKRSLVGPVEYCT